MVTPVTRTYKARRGDYWPGELFRFISSLGAAFWTTPVVRCQLRSSNTNGPVAHEFTLTTATTTEGSNGVLAVNGLALTAAQTAGLNPGIYVGDLEVTSSQMPRATLVSFTLNVTADVTR